MDARTITIQMFREDLTDRFLISPNELHRAHNQYAGLTLRARAMLSALLTYSNGWKLSRADVDALAPELGSKSVDAVLRELRNRRFLAQRRTRGARGRFTWNWYVWMTPPDPDTYEAVCAGRTTPRFGGDGETAGHTTPSPEGGGETAGRTIPPSPRDGGPSDGEGGDNRSTYKEEPPSSPTPPQEAAGSAAGSADSGRQEPETSTQTQTQTRVPNPRRSSRANRHQVLAHPAAAELVDALEWPGTIDQARITASRRNLITAAASALDAGHHPDAVRTTAQEAMPGAETPGSVVAALKTLASQEPDPAIAAAAQRAAAAAERERMATTKHEFVADELTPTYCQRCGRTRNNPNAHGTRTTVDVPAPAMTGGVR